VVEISVPCFLDRFNVVLECRAETSILVTPLRILVPMRELGDVVVLICGGCKTLEECYECIFDGPLGDNKLQRVDDVL
jgi:hypothetical protein